MSDPYFICPVCQHNTSGTHRIVHYDKEGVPVASMHAYCAMRLRWTENVKAHGPYQTDDARPDEEGDALQIIRPNAAAVNATVQELHEGLDRLLGLVTPAAEDATPLLPGMEAVVKRIG